MCLNIVENAGAAPNNLQSGVFFSDLRLGWVADDFHLFGGPEEASFPSGRVLRLHFKAWHSGRERKELPREPIVIIPEGVKYKGLKRFTSERGKEAVREIINFKYLPSPEPPGPIIMRARLGRKWAVPLKPATVRLSEEGTFGGWAHDGYGCFLGYAFPLRPGPLEIRGALRPGPSGLIYHVGEVRVVIDAPHALYVRASDSGATQYAALLSRSRRHVGDVYCVEAIWLREVLHIFPATGFKFSLKPVVLPDYNFFGLSSEGSKEEMLELEYALRLAEFVLEHGFCFDE